MSNPFKSSNIVTKKCIWYLILANTVTKLSQYSIPGFCMYASRFLATFFSSSTLFSTLVSTLQGRPSSLRGKTYHTWILYIWPNYIARVSMLQYWIVCLSPSHFITFWHLHDGSGQQTVPVSTTHPGFAKSGGFPSTGASTPPFPTSSSSLSSSIGWPNPKNRLSTSLMLCLGFSSPLTGILEILFLYTWCVDTW